MEFALERKFFKQIYFMLKVVILGENGSVHIQKWVKAISEFEEIELHVISFDRGVKFDKVTYHPLKIYFNNKLDFFLNTITVRKYLSLINPDFYVLKI